MRKMKQPESPPYGGRRCVQGLDTPPHSDVSISTGLAGASIESRVALIEVKGSPEDGLESLPIPNMFRESSLKTRQ